MEIIRAADRPHAPRPVDWLTGEVEVLAIVAPDDHGQPACRQAHVTSAEYGA